MAPLLARRAGSARSLSWKRFASSLAGLAALVALQACAGFGRGPRTTDEIGTASWYGPGFHARRTANGEVYNQEALTAAHRVLPFHTIVEVRNVDNGRSVRVRINDRGPFVKGRIIDLSKAAARRIDMLGPGTARVQLHILSWPRGALGLHYAVQVGAFGDAGRARALCEELRPRYPECEITDDGVWRRVRVGNYPSREGAERLLRELVERGLEGFVVGVP